MTVTTRYSGKQVIFSRYLGPTSHKPSRITAWNSGNAGRVTTSLSANEPDRTEDSHAIRVKALAEKLGWSGDMVGSYTEGADMVWVFVA